MSIQLDSLWFHSVGLEHLPCERRAESHGFDSQRNNMSLMASPVWQLVSYNHILDGASSGSLRPLQRLLIVLRIRYLIIIVHSMEIIV